jgi:hypothetical protein
MFEPALCASNKRQRQHQQSLFYAWDGCSHKSTPLAIFAFSCSIVAIAQAKTGHTVAAPSAALFLCLYFYGR